MLDLDAVLTYTEFGRLVGVSQQAISEAAAAGVLAQGMTAREMLLAYCGRLREVAAGRASAAGGLDLAAERAALARAQRERIELQNAVTRGELAPVVAIEQVLAKIGARVAGVLDTIPGVLRRRAVALTAADLEIVAAEIARARNVAAAIRLADLVDADEAESSPRDDASDRGDAPSEELVEGEAR